MSGWQRLVAEFHARFGQPDATNDGSAIEVRRPALRAMLIEEEADETVHAPLNGDVTEAIDGLCDLIYVCLGTALEMGVYLDPFIREVHRSNMSKTPGNQRADGKIMKGPDFVAPRIAEMVREYNAKVWK